MAGLDLPDPYLYQGSQQISFFYQYYATDTNEGVLLRASLEHLQLKIGIGSPVLESHFGRYGCLATHSWLKSVWEFLWRFHIHLEVSTPLPVICRENDQFIMELLTFDSSLSNAALISANRCRLHLRLLVFSGMATGGGDAVQDNVYRVQQDRSRTSLYELPKERPSQRDIRQWQTCLSTVLSINPLNLGHWIAAPHYQVQW